MVAAPQRRARRRHGTGGVGPDGIGSTALLGITLLIEAMIPKGNMVLILPAQGSTSRALGIHGVPAVRMIAGSIPLSSA